MLRNHKITLIINLHARFNGHPPLGVNATGLTIILYVYQTGSVFQRAPTLGGECYGYEVLGVDVSRLAYGFNGHPPLGVNATKSNRSAGLRAFVRQFQRAPTLGGECYPFQTRSSRTCTNCFNGHPPLGVNATWSSREKRRTGLGLVSTGTHPWG